MISGFLIEEHYGKFIIFEAEETYLEYSGKSAVTFQDSHTRFQHGEDQQLQKLQVNIFCQRRYLY